MPKKLLIILPVIIILYIVIRYQSIQIQHLQSQIKEQSTRISNIKNHNDYLRKSIHTMIIEGSNRGIDFRNIIEPPKPINTRISKRPITTTQIDRIPIRIEKPVIEPINKEIVIQPIYIQPTVEEPKKRRKRKRDTKNISEY